MGWAHYGFAAQLPAKQLDELLLGYDQSAVLLAGPDGLPVYAFNEQQPQVPASTVKLLTGLMSLEQWGGSFQAETEFYFDVASGSLHIVGTGDPFLISEEIAAIAIRVQSELDSLSESLSAGTGIRNLIVDYSRFKNQSGLPWQGTTSNPYDAVPSAVAANFNTLNLRVAAGRPVSAEEQTPLTRYSWLKAKQAGSDEPIGRINTGQNVDEAARYFGELLATFLWQQGASFIDANGELQTRKNESPLDSESTMVMLAERVSTVSKPSSKRAGQLLYTHRNSRTMSTVVAAMLQYSTNFIANNLALMMASNAVKGPAGFAEFNDLAQNYVSQRFGWKNTVVQEGAGLSTANRLSSEQLVELVGAYKEWPGLMPAYKKSTFNESVFAKTGSLAGVSTLAGTLLSGNGTNHRFAILLQDSSIVDSSIRDKVLTLLQEIVDAKP